MNLGSALHQFTEEHHFINPEILRSFLLSSFPVPVSVGLSSVTARELLTDDAGSYTERVDMKHQATGGRFRTYMKGFNSENTHGHQNKPDPECSAALSERRQVQIYLLGGEITGTTTADPGLGTIQVKVQT